MAFWRSTYSLTYEERLKRKGAAWTFATVAIFGWSIMTMAAFHSGVGGGRGADRLSLLRIGILRCLPVFAMGIVIYRIHRHSLFQQLPAIFTEVFASSVDVHCQPAPSGRHWTRSSLSLSHRC
jgi:hypothetical protein